MIVEKIDKTSKEIVFIYTTCPNAEEARSIGLSVVNEHLAVSADYWPIGSIYPWQNVIQDVEQYMLMLTTEKSSIDKCVKHIEAMHPYSVPMITQLDTKFVNPTYEFWAHNTLVGNGKYISRQEEEMKERNEEENGYHYGKLK